MLGRVRWTTHGVGCATAVPFGVVATGDRDVRALRVVCAGTWGEEAATLEPGGFAPMEALVHRALSRVESMSPVDLAARLSLPVPDVRLCLKALEAKGFVSR